jgi:hypothetical protein
MKPDEPSASSGSPPPEAICWIPLAGKSAASYDRDEGVDPVRESDGHLELQRKAVLLLRGSLPVQRGPRSCVITAAAPATTRNIDPDRMARDRARHPPSARPGRRYAVSQCRRVCNRIERDQRSPGSGRCHGR